MTNQSEDENDELVTVGQFNETFEAELAKGRLDSAGIESFLAGENTAALYGTGLGGLQLQVKPADEADARNILADPGELGVEAEGDDGEPVDPDAP